MKECIVILGMHRSGTSVLSGLVSLQGFHIGTSQMPLREDNPKGFFENYTIYQFNQQILEDHNTSWDNYSFTFEKIQPESLQKYQLKAKKIIKEEFGLAKRIFIKDPRMCLLFPLWEPVLKELGFIIKVIYAFRSPMEVALSLKSRNNFVLEKSLLMWSHYSFQAERKSRSYGQKKRMIVHYAQDYHDLDALLNKVAKFLNIKLTQQMVNEAHKLYTPELKHHQVALNNLSDEMPDYLKRFITLLKTKDFNKTKELDEIINDFYLSQELYLYDNTTLHQQIQLLKKENSELQKQLSTSEESIKHLKDNFYNKYSTLKKKAHSDMEKAKTHFENRLNEENALLKKIKSEAVSNYARLEEENALLKKTKSEAVLKLTRLEEENALLKKTKSEAVLKLTRLEKETVDIKKKNKLKSRKITLKAEQKLKKEKDTNRKLELKIRSLLRETENLKNQLTKTQERSIKSKRELQAELTRRQAKINHSYHHLAVGNEIFIAALSSKIWRKKFLRLQKDNRYFKMKRKLLPLAKQKSKQFLDDKIAIIESGLFSPFYYLTRYPKAWERNVDPLNFFNKHGWKEEQNPGPNFNTGYYLQQNPDVVKSGINPLLHYIRIGKAEGRLATPPKPAHSNEVVKTERQNQTTRKQGLIPQALARTYQGPDKGRIVAIKSNNVSGWTLSRKKHTLPVVKVNGLPTNNLHTNLDSTNMYGALMQSTGFESQLLNSVTDKTEIELLILSEKGITSVDKKVLNTNSLITNKYSNLEKALSIANQPGAVAITVWEGAHNPIGRAKVLYDIVSSKRPVIIFAYIFGSFGEDLWEPLQNSNINIVLIPYAERYSYHAYIQAQDIRFDTIWISKHRLHSFELASFIAKPNTACILDMDDNEDVFVNSKASESKPYGIFSKNKARYYLEKVKARSVASISIQHKYGGEIVRHARKSYKKSPSAKVTKQTKTAVFIGTIRPHKNITYLVDAITSFNRYSTKKVKLALGGDFNPTSLKQTLDTKDTIILDNVSSDALFDTLSNYDIVITSYPDKRNEYADINKLQITSKIGDGLAVGLPVLTPATPSIDDLYGIPGLFIFTKDNFDEQLKAAMEYNKPIKLPPQFGIDHSYKTFASLEKKAKQSSLAKDIFELEPLYKYGQTSINNKNNIVLVWKQHDSGVYGRRIDQIARYYKHKHPDTNVTVIEAINEANLKSYESSGVLFDNSTTMLNDLLSRKIYSYLQDGIKYHLITYKDQTGWNSFDQKFDYFLSTEGIYPHNSVLILFPILDIFNELLKVIKEYKVIVDLVDNQVKWMKKPEVRLRGLKQYYDMISIADEVVSNSPQNIQFFKDLGFFNEMTPHTIANWYTLPTDFSFKRQINKNEINLIYSGNLNDRIDWDLFKDICKALKPHNGYLHIVGTTARSIKEMKDLMSYSNCIYHGVVNEKQLLRLLQHIDFAVIPHVEDHISKFMDPIKLKMYKKLGITSICRQLPDLPSEDPMLLVTKSRKEFLDQLNDMLENITKYTTSSLKDETGNDTVGSKYTTIIEKLFSNLQHPHTNQHTE